MRWFAAVRMAMDEVLAQRARSLVSALGIALGVAVLLVIAALGLGAREVVLKKVVQALPLDMVEVVPKTVDLGFFRVETGGLFGGATLDEETLERLRALPEVEAAYPKLDVKLPLGAQGGGALFRRRLYTDLFLTALPEELLRADVGEQGMSGRDYVPVVISNQLIEIYNGSVASSLGTPKLTSETLRGFEFELVVGRSLMLGSRGAKKEGIERARIVGVSPFAMRLGATVSLETARRLVREYGASEEAETYASIILRARSAADVPTIRNAVLGLGLAVDDTAARTSDLLDIAILMLSLVGVLVLALAGLNIAHSFFAALSERRRELAILRAVGARRVDLVTLVLSQAALIGLAGGVFGVLWARLVAIVVDIGVRELTPDFAFKPDTLFAFSTTLVVLAVGLAVLAAVLGALWPALRAARGHVGRVLAEL